MFTQISLCLLLACAVPAAAQPSAPPADALPPLEVSVKRVDVDGEQVFEVAASGAVRATPAAVWEVLTDYERMPEYVPDLKKTKILSRTGNRVILEQFGVVRFLFFRRSIHLIVQVSEEPTSIIDISLVTGDMKVYHCRWELLPIPGTEATRIVYSGTLVPNFYVPGMLGANIISSDISAMMEAVLERLERPPQAG